MGSRVAAMYPDNPLRQNNVALYAMYAGKFEDAIAGGKKAAELNKEYATAWVSQGLAAAALGRYDDATRPTSSWRRSRAGEGRAALGLADLAMLRGRTSEAAAALEPMLTEKLPPLQLARVQNTLAAVRLTQGRAPEAIKLAESGARDQHATR